MIVLVDMDGVLTDYERGFLSAWKTQFPQLPYIPLEERTTFYPRDDYKKFGEAFVHLSESIVLAKGFYRNLPVMEGALEAMSALAEHHEVFICTSPRTEYRYCVPEKYEWIEQHLGKEWIPRIIMTKDKTLAYGTYLIDDKPVIKGVRKSPFWKQIMYKQAYNTGNFTWKDYRDLIETFK
jgi:5'-nucleotidase